MVAADDIGRYEGLIRSTAARYAPWLDHDFEDIAQMLRLKVWQARLSYDPAKATQPENGYVFSCVRNRVKDLLKEQSRLNDRRNGGQIFIEDSRTESDLFDYTYFRVDHDEVYFEAEDEIAPLPSTLSRLERDIVDLLLLDFNQAEIGRRLGISRWKVRAAQAAVKEKMMDWKPTSSTPLPVSLVV
jgi:RNA polymerase sigma factor (sigma-70 family)